MEVTRGDAPVNPVPRPSGSATLDVYRFVFSFFLSFCAFLGIRSTVTSQINLSIKRPRRYSCICTAWKRAK